MRPEFGSPPDHLDEASREVLTLHQYLVGLRRRHPWLHDATTSALYLQNTGYLYQTRHGEDALIVALNIDDSPLPLPVAELTGSPARLVGGTAAPPDDVVDEVVVPPQGWLVLRPEKR